MDKLLEYLNGKAILEKQTFSGVDDGEKVFLCYYKKRAVIVTADFVSAVKLKKGLEAQEKKCEIISTGREVGKKKDENLRDAMINISMFLNGEFDYLIFLPVSVITKFDFKNLSSFENFTTKQKIDLKNFETKLASLGLLKLPMAQEEGQFAVRGDLIDIFAFGEQKPVRLELFDDEIEKIYTYDPLTMKKEDDLQSFKIKSADLSLGKDDITKLCDQIIIDGPEKIKYEIGLLKDSYSVMSNYNENELADFDDIFSKSTMSFVIDGKGEKHFDNFSVGQKNYLLDFMSLARDLKGYLKILTLIF